MTNEDLADQLFLHFSAAFMEDVSNCVTEAVPLIDSYVQERIDEALREAAERVERWAADNSGHSNGLRAALLGKGKEKV